MNTDIGNDLSFIDYVDQLTLGVRLFSSMGIILWSLDKLDFKLHLKSAWRNFCSKNGNFATFLSYYIHVADFFRHFFSIKVNSWQREHFASRFLESTVETGRGLRHRGLLQQEGHPEGRQRRSTSVTNQDQSTRDASGFHTKNHLILIGCCSMKEILYLVFKMFFWTN